MLSHKLSMERKEGVEEDKGCEDREGSLKEKIKMEVNTQEKSVAYKYTG